MVFPRLSARGWFVLHGWLALPLWMLLLFVCATGTVATVSQEITWLVKPEVRANPPVGAVEPLGYEAIVATIVREHPTARISTVTRPVKSMFAWTVLATYPDLRQVTHYVNPYTGKIQGSEPSGLTFRQFMRELHGWLLVPFAGGYSWGWYAVSILSLPLLGLLASGLVVYKRFWQGYFRPQLRVSQGLRVCLGDLHRLVGIWTAPFLLLMAVTALWFLIKMGLNQADIELPSTEPDMPALVQREDVPLVRPGQVPRRIGLDQVIAATRAQLPDMEPFELQLAGHAFSPIKVLGRSAAWPLLHEFAQVNPYNGKVEYVRRLSDRSALELVTQSMRPLHTGDFVGLWLKLVYFAFGLMLTTMVASGILLWSRRNVPAIRHWRFCVSALALVVPAALLPSSVLRPEVAVHHAGLGARTIGTFKAGPWSATLGEWRTGPPRLDEGAFEKRFALALCATCSAEVKAAYLRVGAPRADVRTSGGLFSGTVYRQVTDTLIPADIDPSAQLWLTLEGWDGSVHRTSVALIEASPDTYRWAVDRRQK